MVSPSHGGDADLAGHLGASMDARNPDLAAWLIPTLDASTKDANGEAPDFFAVGFQEMIALVRCRRQLCSGEH